MNFTVNSQVLVLNASFEPIHICGVKRAIILIVKGMARSEQDTPNFLRSPSTVIPVPAVIRLVSYVHIPYRKKAYSKKHLFLRDNYTCQYCGRSGTPHELTLDHILPQSRGGKSVWENLVTCCQKCNTRKGDLTPREAGMKVLNKPKPLNSYFYLHMVRSKARDNQYWRKYLYYE
ncbi:HNH endonuclease [candidate division KSB1 bacterium]|nr:HNH endonuclease [candidate division KSB1 bacterium]NIR72635.1 HNH endonuclease [candidate division KSB1 bacterium]NIS27346.1 HNH endonuclease [candidate division KSB1 bacterium]NIT73559.1 HNH endonuclease [candidate division KSB1 bacterium]NIU25407.1 HNH endonuclease [candidate division KSB1 bacterium]